jgi:hypothetical protein
MTIIVNWSNSKPLERGQNWTTDAITQVFKGSPESLLAEFIAKEAVLSNGDFIEKSHDLPKSFFVQVCWVSVQVRNGLETGVLDCCAFHDHKTETDAERCKDRQTKDGAFYTRFMVACSDVAAGLDESRRILHTQVTVCDD